MQSRTMYIFAIVFYANARTILFFIELYFYQKNAIRRFLEIIFDISLQSAIYRKKNIPFFVHDDFIN